MNKIRIGITGFDAKENPYPGLAVARSIKADRELNVEIVALTYDPQCTGIYCNEVVDQIIMLPFPTSSEDIIYEFFNYLQKNEPIDILIPCLDSEIGIFSRLSDKLEKIGIKTYLPSEKAVKQRTKHLLYDTCYRLGIPSPKTIILNELSQIDRVVKDMRFPLFVKGLIIDARKAHNVEEAKFHYLQILEKWGYPVLLQEEIVGEEYDIAVLADKEHQIVNYAPIKKFGITARGKAFSGIVLDDINLLEFAKDVIKKLQWVGPCELELLKETSTNTFYLVELNARFPAWISVTPAGGVNMPANLVRLILGEKLDYFVKPETNSLFFRNIETYYGKINELLELISNDKFSFKETTKI